MVLTDRQRRFVEVFWSSRCGTEAARRAGYSHDSLKSLLANPLVRRELERTYSEQMRCSGPAAQRLLRLLQRPRTKQPVRAQPLKDQPGRLPKKGERVRVLEPGWFAGELGGVVKLQRALGGKHGGQCVLRVRIDGRRGDMLYPADLLEIVDLPVRFG